MDKDLWKYKKEMPNITKECAKMIETRLETLKRTAKIAERKLYRNILFLKKVIIQKAS